MCGIWGVCVYVMCMLCVRVLREGLDRGKSMVKVRGEEYMERMLVKDQTTLHHRASHTVVWSFKSFSMTSTN